MIGFLWKFIRQQRWSFLLQFLLCLTWSAKETLFPFLIKKMIDAFQEGGFQYPIVAKQVMMIVMLWIIMEVGMRLQGVLTFRAFAKLRENIRMYILDYVNKHSLDYFLTNRSGYLMSKIAELPRACESFLEISILHFSSIGGAVLIGVAVLWSVSPQFAFLFLGWLAAHLAIHFSFSKKTHAVTTEHSNALATLNGNILDVLVNKLSVLLYGNQQQERMQLQQQQEKETEAFVQSRWMLEKTKIYQSVVTVLYLTLMFMGLLILGNSGIITAGDFALVPMLSFGLLGMVWWLSHQLYTVFREAGHIRASLELLQEPYQVQDTVDAVTLEVFEGAIEFSDITFRHASGKSIFDGFSLSIPAKQKIGVMGLSGAGKSTLVHLLLRLYDLQEGKITIDAQDIVKVTQASLRAQLALMPQEPGLFNRTILENIHYGSTHKDEAYQAATLALCDEFVQKLPQGYHTLVGEKGTKLSGGQRQRIGIARAILKKAPILILDEATAFLDQETEARLQKNLKSFVEDKTVIVIAHRLSSLQLVDRIVVFEDGSIVCDEKKEDFFEKRKHHDWSRSVEGLA